LRQLAEGFKEKKAMNFAFQFPCHGRSRATPLKAMHRPPKTAKVAPA
jgi:hypothetical protein